MKSPFRRRPRGFKLLLFSIVVMVMAGGFLMALWSYQTMDLRVVTRNQNREIAQLAAESALGLAYAELTRDRNWGKDGQALIWEDPSNSGAFGYVSFRYNGPDPDSYEATGQEAEAFEKVGEDYQSVNNLGGQNSVFGLGNMIVPPNACVVVAVAEYRNVRQVAYQIHLGSPLPYSLASEGALTVSGETVVGGLDSLERAQELPSETINTDDLSESGVVSNDEVELSGNIHVVGDVEYLNAISRDSGVTVDGEVKQLDSLAQLPEIRIEDYDPKGDPANPNDDLSTLVERTDSVMPDALENPLYGFYRFSNSVSFPDGLKLDGSGAFVDGDVVLDGPLEGSGLLVATGTITLRGGANLRTDALAAVIAGGDLVINGQTVNGQPKPSAFQGLIYSQGDLTLSNTRTVGTVVSAADATGAPGSLTIQDSQVISTPDTSDFRLAIKNFATAQPGGLSGHINLNGPGWELLEPNPAELLTEDNNGDSVFTWNDSHLKIRIEQPDGSWRVIDNPGEAVANGLESSESDALLVAYDALISLWVDTRLPALNTNRELVDIVDIDLNEFLQDSGQLRAKKLYFFNN